MRKIQEGLTQFQRGPFHTISGRFDALKRNRTVSRPSQTWRMGPCWLWHSLWYVPTSCHPKLCKLAALWACMSQSLQPKPLKSEKYNLAQPITWIWSNRYRGSNSQSTSRGERATNLTRNAHDIEHKNNILQSSGGGLRILKLNIILFAVSPASHSWLHGPGKDALDIQIT